MARNISLPSPDEQMHAYYSFLLSLSELKLTQIWIILLWLPGNVKNISNHIGTLDFSIKKKKFLGGRGHIYSPCHPSAKNTHCLVTNKHLLNKRGVKGGKQTRGVTQAITFKVAL